MGLSAVADRRRHRKADARLHDVLDGEHTPADAIDAFRLLAVRIYEGERVAAQIDRDSVAPFVAGVRDAKEHADSLRAAYRKNPMLPKGQQSPAERAFWSARNLTVHYPCSKREQAAMLLAARDVAVEVSVDPDAGTLRYLWPAEVYVRTVFPDDEKFGVAVRLANTMAEAFGRLCTEVLRAHRERLGIEPTAITRRHARTGEPLD